jgi:general secretion pathway protein G
MQRSITSISDQASDRRGFTIVEILVVIVVVGILAAITIVAYNGIQDRAKYAREQSDMTSLNKLINLYYIDNGSYPSTGGSWSGGNQAFIPGIVPKYAGALPQMPPDADSSNSYLYASDGTNYKLIRYSGSAGLPAPERTNNALADPVRNLSVGGGAWGYWTSGAASW